MEDHKDNAIRAQKNVIQCLVYMMDNDERDEIINLVMKGKPIDARLTLISALELINLIRKHIIRDDEKYLEFLQEFGLHVAKQEDE